MAKLLPTTVIGSYPQPDWLVDREKLRGSLPPRVRAQELWRVAEPYLAQAQDDATALAIADQERAGLDIVTDGEIRRESYSNRFATALEGFDIDNPAMVPGRAGGTNAVPRVVGKVAPHAAGRGRGPEVPAGAHRSHDQDHAARPVHDEPAGLQRGLRATRPSWRWTSPSRSTRRCATCSRPAPTSCRSTSRGCSRARRRRGSSRCPRSTGRCEGVPGTTALHTCFGYAAVVHDKPGRLPVPGRARGLRGRRAGDRGRPAAARPRDARADRAQDRDRRRARPLHGHRGDARAGRGADRGGADRRARRAAAGRPGLRDEVPLARARAREAATRSSRARGSSATGSRPARGRARSAPRPRRRARAPAPSTSRIDRHALVGVGEERVEEQREEALAPVERAEQRLAQPRRRQRLLRPAPAGEVREVVVGVEQLPAERQRGHAAASARPRPASST